MSDFVSTRQRYKRILGKWLLCQLFTLSILLYLLFLIAPFIYTFLLSFNLSISKNIIFDFYTTHHPLINLLFYIILLLFCWRSIQHFLYKLYAYLFEKTDTFTALNTQPDLGFDPKRLIDDHINHDNSAIRRFYIFPLRPQTNEPNIVKNPLINLTHFLLLFKTPSDVLRYFILSFFAYNTIFAAFMIPFIRDSQSVFLSILILILMFGFALYHFVNNILTNIHYDHINKLENEQEEIKRNFLIYETTPLISAKEILISDLLTYYQETLEHFKKIIVNIMQIAMPIFFLAYVSLIVYYHNQRSTNTVIQHQNHKERHVYQ